MLNFAAQMPRRSFYRIEQGMEKDPRRVHRVIQLDQPFSVKTPEFAALSSYQVRSQNSIIGFHVILYANPQLFIVKILSPECQQHFEPVGYMRIYAS